MMRGTRGSSMVISVAGALLLAGCSSSTEPHGAMTPDGFSSRLSVSPTSAVVGERVDAVWTIMNTGSTPISRVFGPQDGHFEVIFLIGSNPHNTILGQVAGDVLTTTGDELTLAPGEQLKFTARYVAQAAGSVTISGCIPPGTSSGLDELCESKVVTVKLN